MQSQLVTVVAGGSAVQIYTLTEKMELAKVNEQYFHHPSISKKHSNVVASLYKSLQCHWWSAFPAWVSNCVSMHKALRASDASVCVSYYAEEMYHEFSITVLDYFGDFSLL